MASKIDVSALTLNAEEAQQVSEAVVEKVFTQGELAQVHDVQTGIQHQKQIVFVANLDVGGEALSGCTPVEQTGIVLSQKYWTPALVAGRFSHCANDLNQLMKLFRKAQRVEPDFFDRIDSQEMGMLMSKIVDALKVSVHAKVWFGDTAAANFAGGGNFTAGTFTAGQWNQFDGLWKQIFGDANVPRYTITENAGLTYVAQALPANKAQTVLQNLYEGADSRLIGDSDAEFIVTRTIWDNYLKTIETTQGQGGIIEREENGAISMRYRGIPIKVDYEMDRIINKYQNDGTVWFRPHRALLTVPSNIPVGTLSESDLQNLESFYNQKDKTNYVDYGYFLDAKHGESYLSSVAY